MTRCIWPLVLAACAIASGADFYVAVNGSPMGDGSREAPWDFPTALGHPETVQAGDTIHLLGGTYTPLRHHSFSSEITGAPGRHVTVRPYNQERVIINGGFEIMKPWVIFRDLEVTNSSSNTNRVSQQGTSFPTDVQQVVGFNVFAAGVKIINNIVHDVSAGMNSWAEGRNNEFYGNLIYYNGWQASDRGHGHGAYMQNQSGVKRVMDNIVFAQFSHGLHFYGSDAAYLNDFHIEGNIVFSNGVLNNEHSRNLLLGGGNSANNPVVVHNYMYFPPGANKGGDHNIGYYPFGSGCTNLRFENNYFVSDGAALTLFHCTVSSLRGNTLYGELNGFSAGDYSGNTYFTRTSRPSGVNMFVRANQYEHGRANIVIFNWDRRDKVSVNVSAVGLRNGDAYELHNAQDYFGDVVTGTFDGKPIEVSMSNRTVARPVGIAAPESTFPEFGVFVIRKVVSGVRGVPAAPVKVPQRRR